MLKKFVNNRISEVPKNGIVVIDGETFGVSNLYHYLVENMEIANKNGYYEYIEKDKPEYNPETEYIIERYNIIDNILYKEYEIQKIEDIIEIIEE